MATLDLTGSAHLQRMNTNLHNREWLDRFFARFDYRYQGLAVVCQETTPGTWSVTTYPGLTVTIGGGDGATAQNDMNAADFVFYGGQQWTVSDANLIAALTTAGYTIS